MKSRALLLVPIVLASALLCSAAAAPALPDPGAAGDVFRIDVPQTWAPLPEQSARLTEEARAAPAVEDLRFYVEAQAWRGAGAGLVVTWVELEAPAGAPRTTARALLDHVRRAPVHASLAPGDAAERSWREDMRDGVADAHLTWAHERNQTVTRSRALVFQAASGRLHLVRADCVTGALDPAGSQAAPAKTQEVSPGAAACDRLLASLAIVPPAAERQPLGTLPPPALAQTPAQPEEARPPASGAPSTTSSTTPSFREPAPGSNGVLLLEPGARKPDQSHQWLYMLGGLLVVIAIYLTTRSSGAGPAEDGSEAAAERGADGDRERAAGDGEDDARADRPDPPDREDRS